MSDQRSKLLPLISDAEARWQRLAVLLGKLRSAREGEARPFEQMRLDEEINETASSQSAVESHLSALEQERDGTRFLAPALGPRKRKLDLYFCYAREDQPFLDVLRKHLAPRFRTGATGWDERGAQTESAATIETARFVVLLVSDDFLASDRLYDEEVLVAMRRRETGDAMVIPIIVRACDWSTAAFAAVRVWPKDGVPIDEAPDRDAALAGIAQRVRALVTAH
jgi:hypothetical protein